MASKTVKDEQAMIPGDTGSVVVTEQPLAAQSTTDLAASIFDDMALEEASEQAPVYQTALEMFEAAAKASSLLGMGVNVDGVRDLEEVTTSYFQGEKVGADELATNGAVFFIANAQVVPTKYGPSAQFLVAAAEYGDFRVLWLSPEVEQRAKIVEAFSGEDSKPIGPLKMISRPSAKGNPVWIMTKATPAELAAAMNRADRTKRLLEKAQTLTDAATQTPVADADSAPF